MANSNNNFLLHGFEKIAQSVSGVSDTLAEIAKTGGKNAIHHNCIGFYEPYENCGMTTAIINVAYLLAVKHNYTVCVVDLNVEKPDAYRYLRMDNLKGKAKEQTIRDKLLNNGRPAIEIANKSRINNVWYISSRFDEHPINYSGNGSDTQSTHIMDTLLGLLAELAVVYDFVLLDIPSKITDVFTIGGLSGADVVYTFHDGTVRTTEQLLKNERILNSIGLGDKLCNIVQSRIASEYAMILSEDFKLVNPNAVLVMNIPYCESVAAIGQGSGVFMHQSKESTKLPSTVRSKYRQLADQVIDSAKLGQLNIVNITTGHRGVVSVVGGMESCEFIPENTGNGANDTVKSVQVAEDFEIQQRINDRIQNAQKERDLAKYRAEFEEKRQLSIERAERERKKAILDAQLAEAEKRNAERAERERQEEAIRKASAAARGVIIAEPEEFDPGLIKTPQIKFENGKIVEVKIADENDDSAPAEAATEEEKGVEL